jgi:thiamine biosynthesis protein ThiS
MKVYVNDKEKEISDGTTIENIIKDMALNKWVSVWVNGTQLLQGDYSTFIVKENDKIKVIRVLAGG